MMGQLSFWPVLGGLKPAPAQTPSLSASFCASPGQTSHASPAASPWACAWLALARVGQLSFCPVFGGLKPVPAQMPSLSWSFWASPGHASQTLPSASPSVLAWLALATVGQLSFCPVLGGLKPVPAQMPSLSWSFCGSPGQRSHASPEPSASALAWSVFAMAGQLSFCPVLGGLKSVPTQIPSLSASSSASPGQTSQASPAPSPSASAWLAFETEGQLSQTSPRPSVSPSIWVWLVAAGQLSQASPRVSASPLVWVWLATAGQLSQASPTAS